MSIGTTRSQHHGPWNPSFPGFAGRVFIAAKDKVLSLACLQAWNDYSAGEWAGTAPGRFIPLAMLPTTPPSELFKKHFYGCFIDDVHGLENRHAIGVERITFEVDYPHSDSNWPNTRKRAAEVFANVPDDEVHQIVELNALRLFRFC